MQKYACLDLGQEEVMAELDLLEAGGLLQLGREGGHLCLQHIRHQIILQAVYQKGHVSASLVLCLDTASLKRSNTNTYIYLCRNTNTTWWLALLLSIASDQS